MADRVDVLGDDRARLDHLGGGALARGLDAELQECVALAAEQMGVPIALVSLVLERTQFFRAHIGLPAELAVAQATDRDASFCQFVVRDGAAFEVSDARIDARVPQELVKVYGIRAYLGVPVVVREQVVGSLCVIDTVSRSFSDEEKQILVELAERASARLDELTLERPPARLLESGTSPAFAEIRNLLVPITIGHEIAERLTAELLPISAILESQLSDDERLRALATLTGSADTIRGLQEIQASMASALEHLVPSILAIEATIAPSKSEPLIAEIVRAGIELAHHTTKLIGGVAVGELPAVKVRCPLSVGILTISSACSLLASHSKQGPVTARIALEDDDVAVYMTTGLPAGELAPIVSKLTSLSRQGSHASVGGAGESVRVAFAIAR